LGRAQLGNRLGCRNQDFGGFNNLRLEFRLP
jgi:hypothetical protein